MNTIMTIFYKIRKRFINFRKSTGETNFPLPPLVVPLISYSKTWFLHVFETCSKPAIKVLEQYLHTWFHYISSLLFTCISPLKKGDVCNHLLFFSAEIFILKWSKHWLLWTFDLTSRKASLFQILSASVGHYHYFYHQNRIPLMPMCFMCCNFWQ